MYYLAYFILPKNESAIFLKFHHLIADAWSLVQIADTILNYYLDLKNNREITEESAPSYIDYIMTEKGYFLSEQFHKSKIFWHQRLNTIPEFIYLKNKPIKFSTRAKRRSFLITKEISENFNRYCKNRNASIFVIFIAVFSIYINQITSKRDITIGTTVLNRSSYKEKKTIGMFINTIPLRINIDPILNFNTYIYYISTEWKKNLRHQRYPISLIVKEYHRQNQVTMRDVYDITINYQNAELNSLKGFNGVKGKWHSCGHQMNSLNIHINNWEKSNQYLIDFDYLVELFTATEIDRLYQHLMNILNNALKDPNKPIALLEPLTRKEKLRLIHDFNRTAKSYPRRNIIQLFERQAQKNPENTALIYEDQRMTYRELNQKANQTAWMLMSKGVKANMIVGLLMKRSLEMFIGILGILKAGGAYLPIDPEYPRKRVMEILDDSNCMVLLTNNFIIGNTTWKGEIVGFNIAGERSDNPNCRTQPNDLAYLIYTSGSTGKPKGVMIEHHSIANTVNWRTRYYQFGPDDVLLQIPPYNFDSSVEDIFSFLSVGAAIVVIDQEKRLDLGHLKKLITTHQVTHFLATPLFYRTMLDEIPDQLAGLSSVTVAGENAHLNLVKKHFAVLPNVKLYNEYGPTENSVCSTVYQFSAADEEVLIGKPIGNCRCYVLNQDLKPLPIGVPGELYLAGEGLARGYINNPELTKEKFIVAPTINERLYKTGDLVKWNSNGNLQFIERIDNQVKIRGYRIELGEIEHHLLKHPAVKEAVVVVDESEPNRKCVCAYIVSAREVSAIELKEYLAKSLPDYMIPSFFVFLEKLPLTPNGKIDKGSLPKPKPNAKACWRPPENEIEEKLVRVWEEVLEVAKIGTNDNIFELGGDSLAIIQIVTMLYAEQWDLTVRDFYKYNTIKELAKHIASRGQTAISIGESEACQNTTVNLDSKFKERPVNRIKLSEPRIVKNLLLTGATGFLGSHILYQLLELDRVKIYILTRGLSEEDAKDRLAQKMKFYFPRLERGLLNRKLTVFNGDITQKGFGLSDHDYRQLLQTIDTVIHTAALVKHYGEYQEFQRVNVLGVQNILEFSRGKYLTHISTTSVAGDYAGEKQKDLYFDETNLDIGQDFNENYYVQTKYEAEKMVLQHINEGLDGTVMRVGNLTGRYMDGVFQQNIQENKFYQILKSFVELGFIPNSLAKMRLEFTPVDLCSQAIVKLLGKRECGGKTFHLLNHNKLKTKDLIEILNDLGYKITSLKDALFNKYIKDLTTNPDSYASLFGIIPDLKKGKLNYNSSVAIDSRYSMKALKELNFIWPQIDAVYIRKIFNHALAVGFIKKKQNKRRKIL